jgi:2,3,4,5-tetrahydropyridine-2-carboxylate N-succinyltransferase
VPTSATDEGIVVGAGAILGANVVINRSTPLIDMTGSDPREIQGGVPSNAVVVAGSTKRELAAGALTVPASIIVGWREDSGDLQKSLYDALRRYSVTP